MANSFVYKKKTFKVGDTLDIDYKIKEGEKERIQSFKGILLRINGSTPVTKMITVRKISNSGIGVERLLPLASPSIVKMEVSRKSNYMKAKLQFLKNLSDQELRSKLYKVKKTKKTQKK